MNLMIEKKVLILVNKWLTRGNKLTVMTVYTEYKIFPEDSDSNF